MSRSITLEAVAARPMTDRIIAQQQLIPGSFARLRTTSGRPGIGTAMSVAPQRC